MRVAVTGASGYVAGWVVRELLARGHHVCGTVRDPSREDKVGHLRALADELPGTLELFSADLMKPGSFREAFAGCEVVLHTASPFTLSGGDPEKDLVEPALEGTRNALADASATESVRRVVLTSSVAAVFGDAKECQTRGGLLDESHWNETSRLDHMPYPYSKTVAEREAWRIAEAQDQWDLVVLNPGFVMGPSLSTRVDGTSVEYMINMATGKMPAMWDFETPWVDVREVAFAHAEATERSEASGRHILSCGEVPMLTVGRWIAEDHPGRFKPPTRRIPKWVAYLAAPLFGFTFEYVRVNVGFEVRMDHGKSERELGVTYRPLRETVNDHLEQLVRDGLIP